MRAVKNTKQRQYIIEALTECREPVTAEEIYREASKRCPGMALTTVYRNLEMLVKNNKVNKIIYSDATARYEYIRHGNSHGHFLVCVGCNRAFPLEECPLKIDGIKEETGFTVTGHNIEIYGYCRDCQKKAEASEEDKDDKKI